MRKYNKEKRKANCVICGKHFELPRPASKQLTCSVACANTYKANITYKCLCKECCNEFDGGSPNANWCESCKLFNCLTCGKEFVRVKQSNKYCSVECKDSNKQLRTIIAKKSSTTKQKKIDNGTYKVAKRKSKSFICENCGNEFSTNARNAKYCNNCKTFVCEVCGKQFTVEQFGIGQKYCSIECRGKAQWKYGICKYCNKEFHQSNTNKKFCNNSCYIKYKSKPENNPNYRSAFTEVTCAICGDNSLVSNDEAKTWVTCSKKCSNIWKRVRKPKSVAICSCVICGQDFEVSPPYIAKKRKVCSQECLGKLRSINNSGKKHGLYGKGHTKKSKRLMSEKAAIRHANGDYNYHKGEYTSKISGKVEKHDSSWELERFKQLDEQGIEWTKRHGIRITYRWNNSFKHYVPDILVKCASKYRIEEVKPEYLVDGDEQTKAKLKAGKRWCNRKGYEFVIITETEIFG